MTSALFCLFAPVSLFLMLVASLARYAMVVVMGANLFNYALALGALQQHAGGENGAQYCQMVHVVGKCHLSGAAISRGTSIQREKKCTQ